MACVSRVLIWVMCMIAAAPGIAFADGLRIYAAGSLTDALTDMVKAFPTSAGAIEPPVFGPSGLLRAKIEAGERADILASADMTQPRRLARDGRPVVLFTRNRLCAFGRDRLGLTTDNLLDRMLDPAVRLATSTPGADPAGDYAWAVFGKADAVHPGAEALLRSKALPLVGGPNTPPLVAGHAAVPGVFLADRADLVLVYCSGADALLRDVPGLVSVPLPASLSVGPAYGMIVLSERPLADRFALFVMSEAGQAILQRHGFDPVGLAGP